MKTEDAIEQAYRNGYQDGLRESMQFITIGAVHINLSQISRFVWQGGELCIWYAGRYSHDTWPDPKKELYKQLCCRLETQPSNNRKVK